MSNSTFRKTKTSIDSKFIYAITYNCSENKALVTKEPKFTFGKRTQMFYGNTSEAQSLFDAA